MNTGKEQEAVTVKPLRLPYPLTKREKQVPVAPVSPIREPVKEPALV